MNEITVLSNVAHPNITAYYGSFVEDNILNVVMEYADNGSLFQHIQRARAPFAESEIVSIAAQLVSALKYLHDKKILHRDLKTKNIFMTKKHKVKLGDFGLSKMMGSNTSFANSAVGTPYYLSPELCEGKPYNRKSDVWALGCVLYELTTFRHAFDATNLPALVVNIVSGQYQAMPTTYSAELRECISACLVKDPAHRPDLEDLMRFRIIAEAVGRADEEMRESMRRTLAVQRPFFDSGSVETALTSALRAGRGRVGSGKGARSVAAAGGTGVGGGPGEGAGAVGRQSEVGQVLSEVEEEQQFERLVARMRSALDVGDRVQGRVPYFKCFVGSDLVTYLTNTLGLQSRAEAVGFGQRWMDAGVFYNVTRTELFYDGQGLYRFKEDEVGSILNMKVVWNGEPRPASEVEEDFRAKLGEILSLYVADGASLVDYEGLALSEAFKELTAKTAELQRMNLGELTFNIKIAFFINLYNALVIHGFVVVGPPTNLYQRLFFYNHTCYSVGGLVYSLNDVEHGILRGNQKPFTAFRRAFSNGDQRLSNAVVVWDPRIHFALVRGTRSCPALRVYHPENLEEALNAATREFCQRHVDVLPPAPAPPGGHGDGSTQVTLPALFEWYREDFGGTDGEMLRWVSKYLPPATGRALQLAVDADRFVIKWTAFDWTLNKKHRPAPPMPTGVPGPRRG